MRRRKLEQETESLEEATAPADVSTLDAFSSFPQNDDDEWRKVRNNRPPEWRVLRLLLLLCRIVGCLAFAYGMYIGQKRLCTHEECDMTYSMRMFLELHMKRPRLAAVTASSFSVDHYRLFKFIDQRDPRHKKFQRQVQPLKGKEWCLDPRETTAALFVPGHGE